MKIGSIISNSHFGNVIVCEEDGIISIGYEGCSGLHDIKLPIDSVPYLIKHLGNILCKRLKPISEEDPNDSIFNAVKNLFKSKAK